MPNPLDKLQSQPYDTRVKILWGVVTIAALILIVLIVTSVKDTIKNAGSNITQIEAAKYVPESTLSYASVERVEQDDNSLKIYFNLNNPGNDILNVPKLSEITFTYGSTVVHPQKLLDRQGNPFAQKILSRTQNFGIMLFPRIATQKGTLMFDQMFLETAPTDVFQQKIWLDLAKLSGGSTVRN